MLSSLLMTAGIGFFLLLLWLGGFGWLTRRASPRRWDLLAGGALAAMTAAFFWRTLSGDVYQPADGGDLVSFLYPTYRFAAQSLGQGQLPLWNPHLYGGAPFIGDIQAGFLYPPNLLLFLLNPEFGYRWMQWLSIGHLWWAGLGVYALVRTLGHSRAAALLAGLAFGFSDALFIHLGNLNLIAVLSWLGWILAAFHRAVSQRSLAWAAGAAGLFAVANYAGHAQSSYYIGLALGVLGVGYWLLGIGKRGTGTGWREAFVPVAQALLTIFVLTFLLTGPILLPALELLPFTSRGDFAYQETVGFSLAPVAGLVGLLTPGFFGRGPALHWGLWDRVELPYAGVVALLLAGGALLLPLPQKRQKVLPWLALGLFGFVVALGIYAPLHGWLTQILPGFGSLRAPARAIVLWALAVSVLAGMGLDELRNARPTPGYRAVLRWGGLGLLLFATPLMFAALLVLQGQPTAFLRASVAGLALALATAAWLGTWLLLALRWRRRLGAPLWAGLLTGLLLLELAAAGAYTDIGETNPAAGFHHPEIVAFLQTAESGAGPGPFRIDARTGIDGLWQPDTAALVGLHDVWGVANPLVLQHWERLWESSGGRDTRLYDLLNVGFVIVQDGTPLPAQFRLAFDAPGPLAVYANPDPLPRAWLVADSLSVADDAAALEALTQPDFDPRRTVILAAGAAAVSSAGSQPAAASRVAVVSYAANEIVLAGSAGGPGTLVLSEVWYPGWRAAVNGEPAPVLRANYALRAVPVPAGDWQVRLWYAPSSWRWGLGLFGAGLLLLAGLLLWGRRRSGA